MNGKQRCLSAIAGRATDRVPVFPLLMLLAADRAEMTYRRYATDARALAEAQLLVRDRFGLDAITACSDAFRVSADLGGEMVFPEMTPPHLSRPLVTSEADLARLPRPDPARRGSRMADRAEAIRIMCDEAGEQCLVLGWVDMPFAEACSVCGVSQFMLMMVDDPPLAHQLLEFLTDVVVDFALSQLEAGAPMIGAGDAAASLISPEMYRQFALPYEQRIVAAVHDAGGLVKLHICGNTSALQTDMIASGADLFNVDHLVDFQAACDAYGAAEKCFKGNLDPVSDILGATPAECYRRARNCVEKAKGKRYILSAGCEIPAAASDDVLAAFCQAAAG